MRLENLSEIQLRRRAVRLFLQGKRPCEILTLIPRSRQWLYKWLRRFEQGSWQALRSLPRRPQNSKNRYPNSARSLVLNLRRKFQRQSVGLTGARQLRRQIIRLRLLRSVPSETTIKRWLKEEGLTSRPVTSSTNPYYPQLHPKGFVLQIMDWAMRYLEGGEKAYVFHTIDAESCALSQTITDNKRTQSLIAHTLTAFQEIGLPDFLQIDNDSAFNGGNKTPRRIGQFVRFCLYFGIELIFIPPAEPKRNHLVDNINYLWARSFFERDHFASLKLLVERSPRFTQWYSEEYFPPRLEGLTVAEAKRKFKRRRLTRKEVKKVPESLPITAGRLHFIRRVRAEGEISLLGESFKVSKRFANKYIWATITTDKKRLDIYYKSSEPSPARLIKSYNYEIGEKVVALAKEYRRSARRKDVRKLM